MTGLAANADFGKSRGEAVSPCVVVLSHAGRMAFRAHEVPVLVQLGPVQDVIGADVFVRVEVKPTLAAFVPWPAVPCDRQCLDSPVGKPDQVLLKRIDAERIFHFEDGEPAVRPVGLHQKFSVLAEETRAHPGVFESRLAEIAENRFIARMGHGASML